jgi:large subunit ribosomal protein L33
VFTWVNRACKSEPGWQLFGDRWWRPISCAVPGLFFFGARLACQAFEKDRVMAGKKQTVEIIALACTECKRRNYTTTKNRKTTQEKLELMKYCKWDHKHTLHKETKVK